MASLQLIFENLSRTVGNEQWAFTAFFGGPIVFAKTKLATKVHLVPLENTRHNTIENDVSAFLQHFQQPK